MDPETATIISLVSLTIAIVSPLMAYWRIHIEYLKLSKKDTSKRHKLITDALKLYAKIAERSKIMLLVVIERRDELLQQNTDIQAIQKNLETLEKLEIKLRKRINKTSDLYEKVAAMRVDSEWDEKWLRAEIDSLVISHRNNFIYDNPGKELSAFCAAGITASMLQEKVLSHQSEAKLPN